MSDTPPPTVLSLSHDDAAQWNRDLMQQFQTELERNPKADLLSMFHWSYTLQHRVAQYQQLSYAGSINIRTVHRLSDELEQDPEMNLLSNFPVGYNRKIKMATAPKVEPYVKKNTSVRSPPKEDTAPLVDDFRTRIDLAEAATVIYPLSPKAAALFPAGIINQDGSSGSASEMALVKSLKKLLWDSPKLWQLAIRGVVVKCSEDIVAKVIWGNRDYTEYTTMQFLAEKAPNIPAPRPHGLIAFGPFRVIFMSYIAEMTLAQAWPDVSHQGKLSIQQQLDDIFTQLRTLQQPDGHELGGVCGEGAKELRIDECRLFKDITTAKEYSDLQFSGKKYGSHTYVEFLRSFLAQEESSIQGSVFTHGDVRTANIMVKADPEHRGHFIITGIIDWEDSGFYPAYHECTALARTLSRVDEDDWYLYLPVSISPSQFPVRWLVDRLYGIYLKTT